jgi:hypothetical protein
VAHSHTSTVLRRCKCNFQGGRLSRARPHVEIHRESLRRFPDSNATQFYFASVPCALPKPPRFGENQFALRIFAEPVGFGPPLRYPLCEEPEGFIGGATQQYGLLNYFRDSSSSRASAVSQNSSRNWRTGPKPVSRIAYRRRWPAPWVSTRPLRERTLRWREIAGRLTGKRAAISCTESEELRKWRRILRRTGLPKASNGCTELS